MIEILQNYVVNQVKIKMNRNYRFQDKINWINMKNQH